MPSLTPETSLAELVGDQLHRTAILDRHGLDYCCGGKTSLRDACAAMGLDAEAILAELTAASAPEAALVPTSSLQELTTHLVDTHHAYLKEAMPRLGALVNKVTTVHGANHPELQELAKVYLAFHQEMDAHLIKEETILFPLCRELEATGDDRAKSFIHQPIRVMELEHDSAGTDLARMRELTNGYAAPADACTSYRTMLAGLAELEADTHHHIHKENNLLFPKVRELAQSLVLK